MYAEIKEMLKYSICKFIQSPFSVKPYSEKLLDSCAICIKYHDQQVTKNALQEVIREAGEECKAQIDDLVRNAIETLESSNYKPDIPKLMKIECPECNEHSSLLGEYEVGSVLFGIAYDSGGYHPVDQDIYDHYSDVRSPTYYCSNCEEEFTETEADDLAAEYKLKYDKMVETDIDIFEGFWDRNSFLG